MSVRRKKKSPYDLDDRLPFGEYKDRRVRDVINMNPQHLHWLWAVKEFEYTKAVWDDLRRIEREQRKGTL